MIDEKKLIDADKLKDDIWQYALTCKNTSFEFARRMSDIEKIIDAQPKLDVPDINVGKWIPCSERLPEDGLYLVTCKGRHNRFVEIVQFGFERFMICQDLCEVIAWYDEPLPEPYKGEEKCV